MIPNSLLILVSGVVIVAYLLGSIPTGYLIAKKLKGIDIREHGSKSTGATNVKRVVGTKAGIATLAIDFLKGLVAVVLAKLIFPLSLDPSGVVAVLASLAAIIGHSRSIFLGFSGGKSVITTLGSFIAIAPIPALLSAAIALTTMKITRIVSIGSMLGAACLPFIALYFKVPTAHFYLSVFIPVYLIYLHRANIKRLLRKEENTL